jgi:hypothetical protein
MWYKLCKCDINDINMWYKDYLLDDNAVKIKESDKCNFKLLVEYDENIHYELDEIYDKPLAWRR